MNFIIRKQMESIISKGDDSGHAFHGNQYTAGASDLAARALQVAGMPYEGIKDGRNATHKKLAYEHELMAERLAAGQPGGYQVPKYGVASGKGEAIDKVIQAHLQAAALHHAAAAVALLPRQESEYGSDAYVSQKAGHSDYLTDLATKASLNALAATKDVFS
jgi:hypothetical protein